MEDAISAALASNPFAVRKPHLSASPKRTIQSLFHMCLEIISSKNPTTSRQASSFQPLSLGALKAIFASIKQHGSKPPRLYGDFWIPFVPNRIITLNLRGCPLVTSHSFGILAGLPKLEHLDLGSTGVTDKDILVLSRSSSLQILSVAENRSITDSCLAHVAGFTSLRQLSLTGTQVTLDGLRTAASALSKLEVLVVPSHAAGFLQTVNTRLLAKAADINDKSSVAELKDFARQLNVGGLGLMRKDELLSTIRGHIMRLMMDVALCNLVQNQLTTSIETSDATDPVELCPPIAPAQIIHSFVVLDCLPPVNSTIVAPQPPTQSEVVCAAEETSPAMLKTSDGKDTFEDTEPGGLHEKDVVSNVPESDGSTQPLFIPTQSEAPCSPGQLPASPKPANLPPRATKKASAQSKSKKRQESPTQSQTGSAVKLRKITEFFQVTKSSPT